MKNEQFNPESILAPAANEVLPEIQEKQRQKDVAFLEGLEKEGRITLEMCDFNNSFMRDAEKVMNGTTSEEVMNALKGDPSMALGDLDEIHDYFNGESGQLWRDKTIIVKELGNVRVEAHLRLTRVLEKDGQTGTIKAGHPSLSVRVWAEAITPEGENVPDSYYYGQSEDGFYTVWVPFKGEVKEDGYWYPTKEYDEEKSGGIVAAGYWSPNK